jgi:hypothetical protein
MHMKYDGLELSAFAFIAGGRTGRGVPAKARTSAP